MILTCAFNLFLESVSQFVWRHQFQNLVGIPQVWEVGPNLYWPQWHYLEVDLLKKKREEEGRKEEQKNSTYI